jgi:hypothetical protein
MKIFKLTRSIELTVSDNVIRKLEEWFKSTPARSTSLWRTLGIAGVIFATTVSIAAPFVAPLYLRAAVVEQLRR